MHTHTVRRLALLGVIALACAHGPDPKAQSGAQIHYDLGVNDQQNGHIQDAYREYKKAIELNELMPEPHFALGLLMQASYHKPELAIAEYQRAIQLRPTYTEAKVNLGTVFLELGRYGEAIPLFREALNDMAYQTPYIAEANLGWALYKTGNPKAAVDHLQNAITSNPKFCLGYKDLGSIYLDQGQVDQACNAFQDFHDKCPKVAEGSWKLAVCQARKGDLEAEKKALVECLKEQGDPLQLERCRTTLEQLTRPGAGTVRPPGAAGTP